MKRHRAVLLALCLTAHLPLAAQRPDASSTALVRVYVVDQITLEPIAGALVEFPRLGRQGITSHSGSVALLGVPAGRHEVRVAMLGYREHRGSWMVHQDRPNFAVELGARPVVLEGVTAQGYRYGEQIMQRRLRSGSRARVMDRARLAGTTGTAARVVAEFGQLTRLACGGGGEGPSFPGAGSGAARPGSAFGAAGAGGCAIVRGMPARPTVFIDDRPAAAGFLDLEMYRADEMYAIEIWRGGRQIRAYTLQWVESQGRRNQPPTPLLPGRFGN